MADDDIEVGGDIITLTIVDSDNPSIAADETTHVDDEN